MNSASDISTSLNLPQRYFIYYRYLLLCWPYISARDSRYQSAVRIQEQSRLYLPRFSWIWVRRREATAGSHVIYGGESKVEGSTRSAACHLVSFATSAYILLAPDDQFCGERFCFVLNNARPLLPLEASFFETARAGQGFFLLLHHLGFNSHLTMYSTCHRDLHQIRWSDDSDLWHGSRWRCQSSKCGGTSGKKVQKAIVRVCFSASCRCLLRR